MDSGSFQFVWPWVFLLAPLPWLVYRFAPAKKQSENSNALWVPFYAELAQEYQGKWQNSQSSRWKWLLMLSLWLLLLCAAARPHWISEEISIPTKARDVMLAVDISGSMQEKDMMVNNRRVRRLDMVKSLLSNFIEQRQGDRMGLVVFGTYAFVHSPLTFDLKTIQTFLNELEIDFAGKSTAIGDSIAIATKHVKDREGDKVLILLTDGSNTSGYFDPNEAARLAKEENIKIYTIGIGSSGLPGSGMLDKWLGSYIDQMFSSSELDEASLKKIAQLTGGQYFRAKTPKELEKVYEILDELEPIEQKQNSFKQKQSLLHWPLLAALLLLLAVLILQLKRGRQHV